MITKIREVVSKLHFIAPVAGHFLLVSCNSDAVMPKASAPASTISADAPMAKFSGEDLFKGIFLFQGPVAKKLPILAETLDSYKAKASETAETAETKAFAADMIQGIKTLDNTYFGRLKDAIASQEPFLIRSVLQEGTVLLKKAGVASEKYGTLFTQASAALEKVDVSKFDTSTPQGRDALAVAVKGEMGLDQSKILPDWVAVETAVVAVVAVGVYILLVLVVAIRPNEDMWTTGLENEQLVAQIVENISPNYNKR